MAKIEVTIGITKNLGNYESLRLEARAEEDVDDVHSDEAWDVLWAEVDSQLEKQLIEQLGAGAE